MQVSLGQSYKRSIRTLSSDELNELFRNIDEVAAVSAFVLSELLLLINPILMPTPLFYYYYYY